MAQCTVGTALREAVSFSFIAERFAFDDRNPAFVGLSLAHGAHAGQRIEPGKIGLEYAALGFGPGRPAGCAGGPVFCANSDHDRSGRKGFGGCPLRRF